MRIAFLVVGFALLVCALPQNSFADDYNLTTLRLQGKPQGTWVRGRTLKLTHIQMKVRNAGYEPAEGIEVHATIPGGEQVLMSGPARILPGRSAVYTNSSTSVIRTGGEIGADISCENCR